MDEPSKIEGSILQGTMKLVGFEHDYEAFVPDLIMHINQAFWTLYQLGVTKTPFEIEDEKDLWSSFPNQSVVSPIKQYLLVICRLNFDIPDRSFVITSLEETKRELEFRLQIETDRKTT